MKKCMIGERYGSLVVIEKVKIPGKSKTYWRCRCDCGNTCTVEDSHLKNGHTKSCGCRRRIRLQEKRLDLTGQRYGRLVVLGPAAGLTEEKEGTVEQSGSSAGDRADRPSRMSDCWLCQWKTMHLPKRESPLRGHKKLRLSSGSTEKGKYEESHPFYGRNLCGTDRVQKDIFQ